MKRKKNIMEHATTYIIFAVLAVSQYICHKLAQRYAKKREEEIKAANHTMHGGALLVVVTHPATIETVHEWMIHIFIYSH
jgi:hypothetical protein